MAETITVTGETPLVDVQSAAVQKVVTKEVVDAIPTGRLGINLAALQPGIILGAGGSVGGANTNALASQDVGGTAGDTFTDLAIHGGKPAEQRQTIGGLSAATTIRFGESLSSSPSFTAMQEMSVNTSGADASLAGGGVQINYVPARRRQHVQGPDVLHRRERRDAGHQLLDRHARRQRAPARRPRACSAAACVTQPGALKTVYDFNPGYGGPIKKDKLWFFVTARWTKAENYVPNDYPNKNFVVGTTSPTLLNNTTMTYVPEPGRCRSRRRSAAADTSGNRRLRAHVADQPEEQARHLLQQQEAEYTNGVTTTSHEALNYDVLLPVLRQPGPVVGAADQQAAARGRLLAPSGDLGQPARRPSIAIRWPSASPTTTRSRWSPATRS